jgi:hypothetical protein
VATGSHRVQQCGLDTGPGHSRRRCPTEALALGGVRRIQVTNSTSNMVNMNRWSASFTQDGHGCAVTFENHRNGTREMHAWTISDAGVVQAETVTATNYLPSSGIVAGDTQELLLRGRHTLQLAVSRVARGEEEHCTCTAVAYFDSDLQDYCARSSPSTLGGPSPSAHNNSTVMVGLRDGAAHFMEFCV